MKIDVTEIAARIDAAIDKKVEAPRDYLGCSMAGKNCSRLIWYSFRWAIKDKFVARVKRMFLRGHNEEDVVIDYLRAAGIAVADRQREVVVIPHVKGHIDGIITYGIKSGSLNQGVLLEIKTHSYDQFKKLDKARDLSNSFPVHYAQMQLYMYALNLQHGLYYAVNKDNDDIYLESVEYNALFVSSAIERLKFIVHSEEAPPKIHHSPSWHECSYCPAKNLCHRQDIKELQINCRTCTHITAEADGSWSCAKYGNLRKVDQDKLLRGCAHHVIHPAFVPGWRQEASDDPWVAVWVDEVGRKIKNGARGDDVFTSNEIVLFGEELFAGKKEIIEPRNKFGGILHGTEAIPTESN